MLETMEEQTMRELTNLSEQELQEIALYFDEHENDPYTEVQKVLTEKYNISDLTLFDIFYASALLEQIA